MIGGQLLAASIALAQDGPPPLLLAPVVANVVATAELLAAVARSATPFERDPIENLCRAGVAVFIGAAAFGVVALAGRLPGPTGILSTALTSAVCIALAICS